MNKPTKIAIAVASTIAFGLGVFFIIRSRKNGTNKSNLKKDKAILFVGDSVTAIVNKNNGKPETSTYPNFLKEVLEPQGIVVDVLARQGEKTDWMLSNLPSKLAEKKYDKVFIYGGINDAWRLSSVEPSYKNVQSMVDLINQSGAKPYIMLGYRIDNFMDINKLYKPQGESKEWNIPKVKMYAEYQANLPNRVKNAEFVKIIDLNGMTKDGKHPTPDGSKIIANEILKLL